MFQFPPNPVIGQQFAPIVGVTYVWNGTGWTMIGNTPASVYPPGFVNAYAGSVSPIPFQGWILCDGASYLTTAFPELFAVIGYAYGGAGANFNVPDMRGRVIGGRDDMGGTAAGRLTPLLPTGGSTGAQTVTLTTGEMPAHDHGFADPGHNHATTDPGHTHATTDPGHAHNFDSGASPAFGGSMTGATTTVATYSTTASITNLAINTAATGVTNSASATGITINSTGGGAAHANVQPTLILNYIIKT